MRRAPFLFIAFLMLVPAGTGRGGAVRCCVGSSTPLTTIGEQDRENRSAGPYGVARVAPDDARVAREDAEREES